MNNNDSSHTFMTWDKDLPNGCYVYIWRYTVQPQRMFNSDKLYFVSILHVQLKENTITACFVIEAPQLVPVHITTHKTK